MSRKPRPERPGKIITTTEELADHLARTQWVEVEAKRVEPLTIPTKPEDLKVGNRFALGTAVAEVINAAGQGVTVHVNLEMGCSIFIPSAFHVDDLRERFPGGIPVLWEPKVITGEMEMTALNVPLGLTVGTVSSTLREVLAGEGALPGERYRVTFEQLPGVE